MKKPIGAIVFFSLAVLFGVYSLISSICHHDRPISIILTAILLLIFAVQLYLTLKGTRKHDDESGER
jgi:phosphate starvation-inducible membrane PsiE